VSALADAALAHAARGWPVLPLRPRAKLSLIAKAEGGRGVHDATTDPGRIRVWRPAQPGATVGLELFVQERDPSHRPGSAP
jgi:hypothetical protein